MYNKVDYSSVKLSEISEVLEQRVRKAIARAKTIGERYEDAPDLSENIDELETALPLTIEISILSKAVTTINKRKAYALIPLVNDALNDLNAKVAEYFNSKVEPEEPEDDDEDIDIDAIFPDVAEDLDDATRGRIALAVKSALRRKKHRRKNPKGTKVKRVPPWETDISEIASLMGEERLASELSEEHPKPLFADLERDEDTGVVRRKRIFKETPNVDVQSALEEFGRFVEEEDKRHVMEAARKPVFVQQPRKTVLSTVEELESLVGVYTAKKLTADRKLTLFEHALAEANEELLKCKVKELVKALDFEYDNLKEDFEEALGGRRF